MKNTGDEETNAFRASKYVLTLPSAISGARGHDSLFRVACVLVNGFDLQDAAAWSILLEYNARCEPPWNERELRHKLNQARIVPHQNPNGYLLGDQGEESATTPKVSEKKVLGCITLDVPPAVVTEPAPLPPEPTSATVPAPVRVVPAKKFAQIKPKSSGKPSPFTPEQLVKAPFHLRGAALRKWYQKDLEEALEFEFEKLNLP